MFNKEVRRRKIQMRIRKKIGGTTACPRLSVYRSNKNIYCQLIDDHSGTTIASASSADVKSGTASERAAAVGKSIAEKAKSMNLETIVFDRGGFLYHGRIKALADAAREAGLKF